MEIIEHNNVTTAIKNSLEGLNSRINKIEGKISDLEDRTIERDTYETTTRDLEVISLEFQREKRKETGAENIFKEIITKKFPNLVKDKTYIFQKH